MPVFRAWIKQEAVNGLQKLNHGFKKVFRLDLSNLAFIQFKT